MRNLFFALLMAALLWPGAALAVQCDSHIKHTERNLVKIKKQLKDVKEEKRPRIQNLINDAEKLLDKAKIDCKSAKSPLDKALAGAKANLAQSNIAAAQLLIKAD